MTRRIQRLWGLFFAGLLCLGSCSADLIRNPNAERWCGDKPCDWQVEGEVERVGTWHPNDYAVSLISDDATLIQENGTVDHGDTDCFNFVMVAKIDARAKVFLELDFLADGSVEFSQRLPASDWQRRTFRVTTPDWYRKVRFIVRKEGPGLAILAELSAQTARGQCTAPPVELLDRPQGAACESDDVCAEGMGCTGGRCGACDRDEQCDSGQVCAVRDVDNARFKVCAEPGSAPLGAACDRDEPCESGVCAQGACSECATDSDCDGEQRCGEALGRPGNERYWPRLCAAGQQAREPGEACTHASDCESHECEGFELRCDPNLDCQDNDTPCISCGPELQLGACR